MRGRCMALCFGGRGWSGGNMATLMAGGQHGYYLATPSRQMADFIGKNTRFSRELDPLMSIPRSTPSVVLDGHFPAVCP